MKMHIAMPEEDDEIDITPMIDCVFLLVLFFMVTSSFIEEAKAFKITLPRADAATTIANKDVDAVSITVDGRFFLRQGPGEPAQVKNLEELLGKLKDRGKEGQPRPFVLRGDARCEYQQIIQVKNALKLAGIETIFEEVEVGHGKGKS